MCFGVFDFAIKDKMTIPPAIPPDIMKHFREEYICSIPEKLKQLEELIDDVLETAREETIQSLRLHVHRIAGSAGTYGFPEVSTACKEFERVILQKIEESKNLKEDIQWGEELISYLEIIKKGFQMSINGHIHFSKRNEIIIVDDDVDLLKLLVSAFESQGFKSKGIADAAEAITYLYDEKNRQSVCLLILDRVLPNMDGLDILKRLPNSFKTQTPVLILSMLSEERDILEGLQYGAVDYISKPFDLSILMEKALALIKRYS